MDNSWHKLNRMDDKTYPQKEDCYLVVCVEPNGRGFGNYYRTVAYFSFLNAFNVKEAIVLYWKEIDWPEDFEQ